MSVEMGEPEYLLKAAWRARLKHPLRLVFRNDVAGVVTVEVAPGETMTVSSNWLLEIPEEPAMGIVMIDDHTPQLIAAWRWKADEKFWRSSTGGQYSWQEMHEYGWKIEVVWRPSAPEGGRGK